MMLIMVIIITFETTTIATTILLIIIIHGNAYFCRSANLHKKLTHCVIQIYTASDDGYQDVHMYSAVTPGYSSLACSMRSVG